MNSKCLYILALIVVVCAVIGNAAWSSADVPPRFSRLSNEYINMDIGYYGQVDFKVGDVGHTWFPSGRFAVSTVGGDPETTDDDNRSLILRGQDDETNIISPAHKLGYWKVKIGNTVHLIGADTADNTGGTGSWTRFPSVFTAPTGLGLGKTGRFMEGEWLIGGANPVDVLITASLVRDQVRMEFIFTNVGTTSAAVGFETIGVWGTDPIAFVPGIGKLTYPKVFRGSSVPSVLEMYDDLASPGLVSRNTMGLQDCTKPDSMAIGNRYELIGDFTTDKFSAGEIAQWLEPYAGRPNGDFVPDIRKALTNPAWTLGWNQKVIAPGKTRKIVTYYGVGAASSIWTVKNGTTVTRDSAALAVQSPRALKFDTTDDVIDSDLSPDIFEIKAYVYNLATDPGAYDLQDVSATLFLPDGLELAAGNGATKSVGAVSYDSEGTAVSWTVQATGEYSGYLSYYVSARDNSGWGWHQSVQGQLLVPVTRKSILTAGWQLQNVPFTFDNTSIFSVFGKQQGEIFANYWDPSSGLGGSYKPVTSVVPGQGFWMYVPTASSGSYELANDATVVGESFGQQTQPVFYDVKAGWNIIGNPFVYPIYWGQVQVYNKTSNQALPLDKAVAANWLSGTLYSWNAAKGSYEFLRSTDTLLAPYKGYWIKTKQALTLIFTPAIYPASGVTVTPGG